MRLLIHRSCFFVRTLRRCFLSCHQNIYRFMKRIPSCLFISVCLPPCPVVCPSPLPSRHHRRLVIHLRRGVGVHLPPCNRVLHRSVRTPRVGTPPVGPSGVRNNRVSRERPGRPYDPSPSQRPDVPTVPFPYGVPSPPWFRRGPPSLVPIVCLSALRLCLVVVVVGSGGLL